MLMRLLNYIAYSAAFHESVSVNWKFSNLSGHDLHDFCWIDVNIGRFYCVKSKHPVINAIAIL